MSRLNEAEIIGIFSSKLKISDLDDVAIANLGRLQSGGRIALKCDMLVASTDVPPTMTPEQTARKSIVACVSDFASKGIRPLAAMVALALPSDVTPSYVAGLAKGFAGASREFGVSIIGGDTNSISNETVIDCSMIGIAPASIPKRNGAMPGDAVAVSGTFGLQSAGLKILLHGARAAKQFEKKAMRSVLRPEPAIKFGLGMSRYFSASMDSSDGLAISLYTIASQSRADIVIESMPTERGLGEFARENGYDPEGLALFGGEEYEIVCTIPKSRISAVIRAAKASKVRLIQIGKVVEGSGSVLYRGKAIERKGYDHFAR